MRAVLVLPVALWGLVACGSAVPAVDPAATRPSASVKPVTLPAPVASATTPAMTASSSTPPSERPSPDVAAIELAPDVDTFWGKEGGAWVKERVKRAKAGRPELVRIPLVEHGPWGCECPSYFAGVELNSHGGDAWIEPVLAADVALPGLVAVNDGAVQSAISVVEGWFTGDMETMTADYDKTVVVARMARFKVVSVRKPKNGDGMPQIVGGPLPPFRATKPKKPR